MKKLFALLLAAGMMLCITACFEKPNPEGSTGSSAAGQTIENDKTADASETADASKDIDIDKESASGENITIGSNTDSNQTDSVAITSGENTGSKATSSKNTSDQSNTGSGGGSGQGDTSSGGSGQGSTGSGGGSGQGDTGNGGGSGQGDTGSGSQGFGLGDTTASVYTNQFGGFKITSPGGTWSFADEEYILSLMNIAIKDSDILTDEQKKLAEIAKQTTIYDAMLSNSVTGSNFLVMFENLQKTGGTAYSAKQYADVLKSQLIQTGAYTVESPTTTRLAGKDYVRLDGAATTNGVTVAQSYFIRKIDTYMLTICVTKGLAENASIDSLVSMISAL